MKANEFIKEHGLAESKRVLHDARGCVGVKLWGRYEFSTDDLKRLVESHELVARYGTADEAKEYLPMLRMDSYDELKQAILDVESCQ